MAWRLKLYRAESLIFTITLVFFTVSFCDSENCQHLNTGGITVPEGDIIIEDGSPLEIFCKLHDNYMEQHPNISSSDMMFLRNTDPVSSEWVTQVNESTIRLFQEKLSPSKTLYTCKLRDSDPAICLNYVIVGTKPAPVKDFSCISNNYDNLTCTWTEQEFYVKTSYNLSYHFPGRSSRIVYSCPKLSRNNKTVSCFWNLSTRPHYRQAQQTYFFILNTSNMFGNVSQKINFSHFANVIPAPPSKLRVVNKTSNSVTLSWEIEDPMNNFPPGLTYRIIYQSEFDSRDQWHVADTSGIYEKNFTPEYTLTGLKYAHVLYDIRVSMRSVKALDSDIKMWSKNVSLTVRTESALPGAPPKVDVGGFEIISNRSNRDIFIYWQSVPEQVKNGENFSVKILVSEGSVEKNMNPVEITNTYAKFVGLSMKNHSFKIMSTNEIGNSLENHVINVNSSDNRIPEPISFTKISFGQLVYEVSWVAPKLQGGVITNYTIFYCLNERDRPFQCTGFLDWVVVPGNTTVKNVTVSENKTYQFAISANTDYGSSGMVWASCTVIHNKELTKVKNLWIDSIGSDFIEVGWKMDCADRIGSIEYFNIFYCPIVSPVDTACKDAEKHIKIKDHPVANRGKITNLKPYTTYMVYITVQSKHNNGLPSDNLYNTTLEAAPEPPENITVTNITNSSMVIQWSPPKAMNGVLRYYEVVYSHNEIVVSKKNEKDRIIELTDLKSYTDYNITIYAYTIYRSKPSVTVSVKTEISNPGKMRGPSIKFQNETTVLIGWSPPTEAGGPLNQYQLRIKEKVSSKNYTTIWNTTELQWQIQNCPSDKSNKVLYFSVRARNIDKNSRHFVGEWSEETEYYCRTSTGYMYWIVAVFVIGFAIVGFFVLRRLWNHCKVMRDVEVKLPPGLSPPATNDLVLNHWPGTQQKSSSDDPLKHLRTDSSADEEHLLTKKTECSESHERIASGDSSGCSSGHESVTSSLASGTNLSSTSDSGTEQPRTPSSESMSRENSLRQRRTGSETLGWDSEIAWPNPKSGYVSAMPITDKPTAPPASWASKSVPVPPSNYCVLGVDTITPPLDSGNHGGYVPVPISIPHQTRNSPYVTCDTLLNKPVDTSLGQTQNPAYVKTSDPMIMGKSLMQERQEQHSPGNKFCASPAKVMDLAATDVSAPTYVMAGGGAPQKSRPYVPLTGKLINIEPTNDAAVENYIQHAMEKDINPVGTTAALAITGKKGPSSECVGSAGVESGSPAYVKTDDMLGLKSVSLPSEVSEDPGAESADLSLHSYCRLGWDRTAAPPPVADSGASVGGVATMPRKAPVEPSKGYVPHRQFENKSLKED